MSDQNRQQLNSELAKAFADLNLSAGQMSVLETSVIFLLQECLDYYLFEALPDEFFENLDDEMERGELTEDEVYVAVAVAHEAAFSRSLQDVSTEIMHRLIPMVKRLYQANNETITNLSQLPDQQKQEFARLVNAGDTESAAKLLDRLSG